jgi:predicted XRE-type DNA-binding protein
MSAIQHPPKFVLQIAPLQVAVAFAVMAQPPAGLKKSTVCRSSGNVFADLRIPNPDQYLAKAELAAKVLQIVQQRRLTQAAAGKLLGITQPKVSALLNGRLDGFSSDRLFRFLNALGCDVRITVSRPHPKNRGDGQVMAS